MGRERSICHKSHSFTSPSPLLHQKTRCLGKLFCYFLELVFVRCFPVKQMVITHLSLAFPGVDPRDTHGEPPGTHGEWYIFDNFLGVRGGDIVWFWKRTLQTPGMHPGIWSPLVSSTWFSKSRMNSLPPFVCHFLDLLHLCSSSCRCTKPGMFYEEEESLLLPTVSMNSL